MYDLLWRKKVIVYLFLLNKKIVIIYLMDRFFLLNINFIYGIGGKRVFWREWYIG